MESEKLISQNFFAFYPLLLNFCNETKISKAAAFSACRENRFGDRNQAENPLEQFMRYIGSTNP